MLGQGQQVVTVQDSLSESLLSELLSTAGPDSSQEGGGALQSGPAEAERFITPRTSLETDRPGDVSAAAARGDEGGLDVIVGTRGDEVKRREMESGNAFQREHSMLSLMEEPPLQPQSGIDESEVSDLTQRLHS
jgi:hypothetical protein